MLFLPSLHPHGYRPANTFFVTPNENLNKKPPKGKIDLKLWVVDQFGILVTRVWSDSCL